MENSNFEIPVDNKSLWNVTGSDWAPKEPPIGRYYNENDCHIPMAIVGYNMPIPFIHYAKPPKMIFPDKNGFLNIQHGQNFTLSCVKSKFEWPIGFRKNEIIVKCINKTLVKFRGKAHDFNKFICKKLPTPKMIITGKKCQNRNTTVILRIGFQTRYSFLNMYRICFDTQSKNPLYAWYQVETPKSSRFQVTDWPTQYKKFINTTTYGDINMIDVYERQYEKVLKIIQSELLAEYYIVQKEGEVRYLAPGYLITPRDFPYNFLQQATYYFENTAPQWYKFQILIWRKIQESIDKILSRKANLRQLVVAGVSEICTLHDEKVQRRFLYLYLPKVVTVPKFFWKMIYDYKTRKGTVFIGLNTAFNTYIREKRLCQSSMCPGFPNREDYERALIYCCSKESFEAAYGRLDSHVYQKF